MSILGEKIDISGGYVYSLGMSASRPVFDPDLPFNDLPPLPPPTDVETTAVLKAVIKAREQLAALDTACRLIPNPHIITSTIPLREAQASTEIENIVTTNDELFRAAWSVDTDPSPATKEALRYREALRNGVTHLDDRPVSVKTAEEIGAILQGRTALIRATPGTFIGDPTRRTKVYTPPEGKEVIERHLSSWERFIYLDHGLDPLVLMAVTHYQFEAIHPFYDGNGRTGRILNVLLLIQEGLLKLPVLYLSGFIVSNKSEYYRLLRAVTEQSQWEEWVLFMVRGVEYAAREAYQLIDRLRQLQEQIVAEIRELGGIQPAAELAELLMVNPYVRIQDVIDAGLARRQTASGWLAVLVEEKMLVELKMGRQKIFINTRSLDILTSN
ncbi:Fic family protein [Corynebacterium comes]|uniref:Fic family protein n=1 Tax=Corynebacterium comes TaxID=2675218 RepID=UPI0012E1B92B|nr:Fic/DOC family N-terminal domain-containing protein [Corynebacterium comes]